MLPVLPYCSPAARPYVTDDAPAVVYRVGWPPPAPRSRSEGWQGGTATQGRASSPPPTETRSGERSHLPRTRRLAVPDDLPALVDRDRLALLARRLCRDRASGRSATGTRDRSDAFVFHLGVAHPTTCPRSLIRDRLAPASRRECRGRASSRSARETRCRPGRRHPWLRSQRDRRSGHARLSRPHSFAVRRACRDRASSPPARGTRARQSASWRSIRRPGRAR